MHTIKAPAKLNLFLEVGPLRDDGYHEVRTLMVPVTIFDRIRVSFEDDGLFEVSSSIPLPENNTLRRACVAFRERTGIGFGLRVKVDKAIPPGSGLGGGSSDGAALLRFLNSYFGEPLSVDELARLSYRIGMDAPFFVYGRPAFMVGRGEELDFFVELPDLDFLVAWPSIEVRTAEVYRKFDEMGFGRSELSGSVKRIFKGVSEVVAILKNDLEPAFLSLFPHLSVIKGILSSSGAAGVSMTGSGSSFFSVWKAHSSFDDHVVEELKRFGCKVFRASMVKRVW